MFYTLLQHFLFKVSLHRCNPALTSPARAHRAEATFQLAVGQMRAGSLEAALDGFSQHRSAQAKFHTAQVPAHLAFYHFNILLY